MRTIRAVFRIFLLALLSAFVVGTQMILLRFYRGHYSYVVPILWQRGTCRIFNIRMESAGKPFTGRQVFYVGNHLSYLDIPAFGRFVMASFVARGDLEHWPIFGYMGKMQQTVYISRDPKDAAKGKEAIDRLVKEGKNLIIFAEATSSAGTSVLPFKSSLFSLALENADKSIVLQPFTMSLLEVDGRSAADPAVRDMYSWYGDMDFEPHMWNFAKLDGARLLVKFHQPLEASTYTDRKALCRDCYNAVASGLVLPETLARAA